MDEGGEDGQSAAAAVESSSISSQDVDTSSDERHIDDTEGCAYQVFEDRSNTLSFITINGDRYTVSKKSKSGLSLYLRCASTSCHKQRTLTRTSVSDSWAQARVGAVVSLHTGGCVSDVSREQL